MRITFFAPSAATPRSSSRAKPSSTSSRYGVPVSRQASVILGSATSARAVRRAIAAGKAPSNPLYSFPWSAMAGSTISSVSGLFTASKKSITCCTWGAEAM